MEESITAYQGKCFCVNLESHLGSTNYGWCLLSMPAGVILAGQANEPIDGMSLVNQKFFFIPTETPDKQPMEIEFGLCCLTQVSSKLNPFKYEEKVIVHVNIVPSNELEGRQFVRYTENEAHYSSNNSDLLSALKYGYPPLLKYGYPPVLKYGYPCQENECVGEKYGFPPVLKYGYPSCCEDECVAHKYGYPPVVKYGYPPVLKYGYPCQENECAGDKYGYPPILKYGYPSCREDDCCR